MNWTEFTRRIFIKAPKSTIYNAWSQSGKLEEWFLEKASYTQKDGSKRGAFESAQAGDGYTWKWNNWDPSQDGEVTKANDKDEFEFVFGKAGTTHVSLKDAGIRGVEIILRQYDIPTDDESKKNYHIGCSLGWSFWMVNLKAWLEHGIVLNQTGLGKDELGHIVNS